MQELLQPIFNSPEEYGDLFLDVTDALTECGKHVTKITCSIAIPSDVT